MNINQILGDKGRKVETIDSSSTLRDAATVLDNARIGAVVALESSGHPCGVLSERDIVRHMARSGQKALSMKVADAMTRDIITTTPTMTVQAALALMTDRRIRHLPVIEDQKLIGVVSIGDLVKWKIAETEAEAEAMKSYIASG